MRPPVKFHWKGNHHSYYGISFIAFGIFNLIMGYNNLEQLYPLWCSIIGIGVFMFIDDIIEHNITADTPLRRIWEWILKWL